MTISHGANQRAHIRHPVEMPAALDVAATGEFDVLVRDFCLGGMLVHFRSPGAALGEILKPQDPVTVSVAVTGLRGPREVTLTARVARVVGLDAGLRFDQPDATALLAMHNHVRALLDERAGELRRSLPGQAQQVSGEQRTELLSAMGELMADYLALQFPLFVHDATDRLRSMNTKRSANPDQDSDHEAVSFLEQRQDALMEIVVRGVTSRLEEAWLENAAHPEWAGNMAANQESMAEDQRFQHWLAMKVMTTRVEGRYHTQLLHLQVRFNQLLDSAISPRSNPLHPASLCDALADALTTLPGESAEQKRVLEAFEEQVLNRLGQVYIQCNKLLSEAGILTNLR